MSKPYEKVEFKGEMNMDYFCKGLARVKEMMIKRLFDVDLEIKCTYRKKTEEEMKAEKEKKLEKEVI
ncbi:hypothetical protein MO316_13170 [Clostridioides difficile]|uniref:hypothetical protein n=1 Tax=Clostridioides TaxID=1870884 RepID=UPI000D1ECDD2|nr:hypothetical protein [Clostridioides difficile]MCC0637947.1 hypothetical protein [Clostridioides sp. ES-S-0001-02]MCI0936226.1 hypothetical protein [Clostridioides difficile]MCI2336648.1 hypothetical protein [Clostridioides difficile]MCZ1034508.1 hypothetical protein [Clostridioides difficile]MDI6219298.1 hypothetical protein [Clostridioides difficile]